MGNAAIAAPVRITFAEWCEREGISEGTGRDWVSQGRAPHSYRLGRRRVMDLTDVLQWENDIKGQAAR